MSLVGTGDISIELLIKILYLLDGALGRTLMKMTAKAAFGQTFEFS